MSSNIKVLNVEDSLTLNGIDVETELGGKQATLTNVSNIDVNIIDAARVNTDLLFVNGQNIVSSIDSILDVQQETSEPTGFINRTNSNISFNDLTRTFSITTTTGYDYFIKGVKYNISVDKSITIPDVDGSYFFYLDATQTLNFVTTFDTNLLRDYVFIASANWSTTQSKILGLAEERHGTTMDWATHAYLHSYVGARIRPTDFVISNFVLNGNGSSESEYQASFGNGTLTDEDINNIITNSATPLLPFEQVLSPSAEIPIMYKIGNGEWYLDDATSNLVKDGISRIQYNLFSGTWSSVDVANTKFVAMWVFATNFHDDPIRILLGQREDSTLIDANTYNTYESLNLEGLAIQEYKILYRLIFQTNDAYTNTLKARLVQVADLRKSIDQGHIVTSETNNHSLLINLTNDDHTQYHTDARGDARYFTKSELNAGQLNTIYYTENEVDILLSTKSNTNHTHADVNGTTNGFMSSTDFNKLSNIEPEATKNETDTYLVDRTNHTGTQDVSTITGLVKSSVGLDNVDNTSDIDKPISNATQTALDDKVDRIIGKDLSTNDFTDYYKDEADLTTAMATELGSSVNVSGGVVSLTGGINFSISPGVGYTRDNTNKMIRVSWSTLTGVCENDGDNFINVDYQGNVVISSGAAQGDLIALGYIRTAFTNTTVVGFSNTRLRGNDFMTHMGELFRTSIGSLVQSGVNTAMQDSPNELKLTVGAGFIWSLFNRFAFPDTSTFTKLFNSSDYGFVPDTVTTANTVNTALYNNPANTAATALIPLTTGYYKKDLIAITPEGSVFYIYATSEYALLDDVRAAPTPAVPESIKLSIIRSAAIIVQEGATAVEELIDIRPMFSRLFDTGQAATNATVISHSNLTDLGNDDHTQYLNTTRGDTRYYRKTELDAGSLDTRYYTESEISTLLLGKSNTGHTHVSADIIDLSATTVGLGNVPNTDTTNASNISSGTLANARLSANLTQIGNLTKVDGDIISVVGGVYVARTLSQYKTDLLLNNVANVDTTNASNISTGTLANARLSANLSDIGNNSFNTGDMIQFNGTNLINVSMSHVKTDLALVKGDVGLGNVANVDTTNASNISTGTLANARLSANLSDIGELTLTSGDYFRYNGSNIVNITTAGLKLSLALSKSDVGLSNVTNFDTTNASNISTGTLANARLSTNIAQLGNTIFATNDIAYYNGSTLTNITPSGYKALLSLTKSDVGLGNVVNSLQVINAGNGTSLASGSTALRPVAGTNGRFYGTTDGGLFLDNGTSWILQQAAISGDISIAANSTTATLATVNSNVGTFNNVTVNGKGLVTAASNVSYLTANQNITVSGDLTGSGTTGLALTLATVNSNIGTFNNVTVNGKGLVTAASNVAYITGNQSITLSGDFTGSGTTAITGTLATVNSNVGTFGSTTVVPIITVNGKGLVTAVSTAALTNASVGLGNVANSLQVINTGNVVSIASGLDSAKPVAGTLGRYYNSTDIGGIYRDNGVAWQLQSIAYTGDVTSSVNGTVLTLATVNSNVGTFNNVTVNGKGLVTAASNVAYITGNQTITVSGDITGSGTTSIGLTLATVNSNVGTFGSTTVVPVITTNAKGLITAVSSANLTNASVGLGNVSNNLQVINAGNGVSFASGTLAARPVAATNGRLYATTNDGIYLDNGASWILQSPAYTGDVTKSANATTLTLATVNSNVGTFNNVTINAKGLATAASNVNYLLDPAANGIVVRTAINTTTNRTLTGTANQTAITNGDGVAGNPTIAIASNPVLPGTASTTIPIGTTAERDTATNGQLRFNSTLGYTETSSGNVYHALGKVIQFISGDIIQTTGTTILPYDATLPTSTEGFQIWTATITPTYTTSTIVIIFNVYAECSSVTATTTLALYNGTTAISIAAGRGVNINTAMDLSISKRFVSGTISPITLSARIGPSAAASTVYVNKGNVETFGGTTNSSYIIMEII